MKHLCRVIVITLTLLGLTLFTVNCASEGAKEAENYIRTVKDKIVNSDGSEFIIKGVSIGCQEDASLPYDLDDFYGEISSLGFNTARIHLDYELLEDDNATYKYKDSGWAWIDAHINAAAKYGIYIKIDMYRAQGGIQGGGAGVVLWKDVEYQNRFTALWKAIAERYADNPTVIGYNILGEPCIYIKDESEVNSITWKNLAQRAIYAIRTVDTKHIIFVERVNSYVNEFGRCNNWDNKLDPNMGFVKIKDNNYSYEYHFYAPYAFTHQDDNLNTSSYQPYLIYPNKFVTEAVNSVWMYTDSENPKADTENIYPQELNGVKIRPPRGSNYATLGIEVSNLDWTSVTINSITVEEYDKLGNSNALYYLSMENRPDFYLSSSDGSGELYFKSGKGIVIKGTNGEASANLYGGDFEIKPSCTYRVYAVVTVDGYNENAVIKAKLEFKKADKLYYNDIEYMQYKLLQMTKYAHKAKVPVIVGEFGLIKYSMQDYHNGEGWINDMFDVLNKNKLGYVYFAYEDKWFGIRDMGEEYKYFIKSKVIGE